MLGSKSVPDEIPDAGGPLSIKQGISTVIGAEAAYFINPYLGFGLRARINSTTVTPRWNETEDVWTYGTMHYDPATNSYTHPNPNEEGYRHSTDTYKDQLSSFDLMGGVYGQLPLSKRMSLGGKLLFGHRQSGDVWYVADMTGTDNDYQEKVNQFVDEIEKIGQNLETYDCIKGIDLDGRGSFIFGTGISFSYALKHNIVWRICLDYDFTRTRYDYLYQSFSLVEEANDFLRTGMEREEPVTMKERKGSFKRSLHQITPSFGICFSF